MNESVFMRFVSGLFGIWFIVVGLSLTGCQVWDYVNRNCKIESQVSGQTFFCIVCNFDNANDQLKKQIEKRIDQIGQPR